MAALAADPPDPGVMAAAADAVMVAMVRAGHLVGMRDEHGHVSYHATADGVIYAISLIRLAGVPKDVAMAITATLHLTSVELPS